MGLLKTMRKAKKKVNDFEKPEEKITSIPEVPGDPGASFQYFVRKLAKKKIKAENAEMRIHEVTQEGLKATFDLVGMINSTFTFTVRLDIGSSATDIYYWFRLHVDKATMMGFVLSSATFYNNNIVPLVIKTATKALKPSIEKEKAEKVKTPKDPLKLLKLKFVEGEISEEEYVRKKKLLEDG